MTPYDRFVALSAGISGRIGLARSGTFIKVR